MQMRSARLLVFVGVVLGACAPSAPPEVDAAAKPQSCGTLEQARFDEPGLPARDYYVYVPCGLKKKEPPPLVVYLHGCTQTGPDAATQTRWNTFADAHHLIVAYPEQFDPNDEPFGQQQLEDHLLNGNGGRCWNWFRPEHVMRGAGEAGTIAGITQRVMDQHRVDPDRVFVMGISAGGAMTGVMAATYPDLYAAAALLAGVPYPLGTDSTGALAAQAMGERAHPMPAMIVQGTADELVVFPLGVATVQQWLGTNDIIDDGVPNGSVPRAPASSEDHGLDESALTGVGTPGDICVGNRTGSPCPGGALGFEDSYPYTIEHYVDAAGAPLLDFWIIHGLMHNYAGGDPSVAFSDPLGPDITQAAYDFFMAHPRTAP
jgi:poly(hydroxyalkanoate) depolymerase family esterase